jgi:hypothetical protein
MSLTPDSIVVAAADQISTQIDDEAALLNLKTGVYYGLDPMGAYIWKLLSAPITVRALQTQLEQDYEVSADIIARDLDNFLNEMLSAGLIVVNPR